ARLCARITRGADGDIVTQEEPPLHLISRRASPVAAAVVSAVITVGSAAPALAGVPTRQAQVSSAAPGKDAQSSEAKGSPLPITVEMTPIVVEVKISAPLPALARSGAIAIRRLTLRELYDESELIVVGRAAGSSTSGVADSGQVKTRYQVASVIKGKSRRQQISVTHYGSTDASFAEGKTALLFLSKGNSENGGSRGGYVLADFSTGIKALPQPDIDIYVERIRDLEAIERRDHTAADIIEWLVQCAEDPATRWEGANELATEQAESLGQKQSDDDE